MGWHTRTHAHAACPPPPLPRQVYRRTLLVIWPRSQALANAKEAGLTALLSLLEARVAAAAELRARGAQPASSQDPGSPAYEVLATLEAAVQAAARAMQAAPSAAWWRSSTSHLGSPGASARLLELGAKAVRLGVAGATEAVVPLALAACASAAAVLPLPDVVAGIAAVAAAVGPQAVERLAPQLELLAARALPDAPHVCLPLLQGVPKALRARLASAALAAAPGDRLELLLALAAGLPGLPALQQAAVDKAVPHVSASAAAAARAAALAPQLLAARPQLQQQLAAAAMAGLTAAGPAGVLGHSKAVAALFAVSDEALRQQLAEAVCGALRGAGAAWQVTGVVPLLRALEAHPDTHAQVRDAALEALFGGAGGQLVAAQSDDSLLQLVQLLLADEQLQRAHMGQLAAGVARRADTYDLLKRLLALEGARAALAEPGVQALVRQQVRNLAAMSVIGEFSWRMPDATCSTRPSLNHFLRSADQKAVLRGFRGLPDARSTAWQLNGGYGSSGAQHATYSITAREDGRGAGAYVVVTKTRGWWERHVAAKRALQAELAAVKALLQPGGG